MFCSLHCIALHRPALALLDAGEFLSFADPPIKITRTGITRELWLGSYLWPTRRGWQYALHIAPTRLHAASQRAKKPALPSRLLVARTTDVRRFISFPIRYYHHVQLTSQLETPKRHPLIEHSCAKDAGADRWSYQETSPGPLPRLYVSLIVRRSSSAFVHRHHPEKGEKLAAVIR
jgi:hypothetical protein